MFKYCVTSFLHRITKLQPLKKYVNTEDMVYYHVIAKVGSEGKSRCLFSDLSVDDLQDRFIKPYENGKSFFSGNDLISPYDLRSIQIIQTDRPDQVEREEINRKDRARIDEFNNPISDPFIVGVGGGYEPQDIAEAGEDLTHTLLKGEPGFRVGRWVLSLKAIGWIAGIIATIIAAGIIKWLGWV